MHTGKNDTLNKRIEGLMASLTEEQQKKVKGCQDVNELTALLGELGAELPDELLEAAAGGRGEGWEKLCTRCGVNTITPVHPRPYHLGLCLDCYSEYLQETHGK